MITPTPEVRAEPKAKAPKIEKGMVADPMPFNVEKFLRMAVELEDMFLQSFDGCNGPQDDDDASWVWVCGHEVWYDWNDDVKKMAKWLDDIRLHAEMLFSRSHAKKMEAELRPLK